MTAVARHTSVAQPDWQRALQNELRLKREDIVLWSPFALSKKRDQIASFSESLRIGPEGQKFPIGVNLWDAAESQTLRLEYLLLLH
jgi:hypothetical protein